MDRISKSELAALYALGMLEPEEARRAAELLAVADPDFTREAAAFQETVADLALLAPRAGNGPRASLKDRVLERANLPRGLEALVPSGLLPWKPSPFPGVSAKKLYQDPDGNVSWLVRLEPGSTYPRHRHSTREHCLVLEGEVEFDEYTLRPGDYEVAGPGTDHSAFYSPNGAVLFIIANKHDEIFT